MKDLKCAFYEIWKRSSSCINQYIDVYNTSHVRKISYNFIKNHDKKVYFFNKNYTDSAQQIVSKSMNLTDIQPQKRTLSKKTIKKKCFT